MDPITIVLALVGLGIGFGANTVITKKKMGDAEVQAKKELEKTKRESQKIIAEAKEKAADIATGKARKSSQAY